MLKFERKKIDLDLYGEKFVLRYPTVKDRQDYQRSIEDLNADDKKHQQDLEEKLYEFLDTLGLPSAKAKEMYDADLVELVNHLMPSKKK